MPLLTLDISDDTASRLDLVVSDYNAGNGTSLTRAEYLALHLRELAVQREFASRAEQLKKQHEDDLAAAINAERERLLAGVGTGEV